LLAISFLSFQSKLSIVFRSVFASSNFSGSTECGLCCCCSKTKLQHCRVCTGGTEKTPIRAENLRVLWAELAFDVSERRTFSSRTGDGFRDSDAADRHWDASPKSSQEPIVCYPLSLSGFRAKLRKRDGFTCLLW
jgi:hypothetical protein